MGKQIDAIPHSCGTSKGLKVFEQDDGVINGYCFACGTFVPDPYEGKPKDFKPPSMKIKTPDEIQQELDEILEYGFHEYPDRSLNRAVHKYFGVRISLSEHDGSTPTAQFFPYYNDEEKLTGFKVKTADGNQFARGTTKGVVPFGWHKAIRGNRYKLFITEGENDAMALFLTLKRKWKYEGDPAVISLPHGAGAAARSLAHKASDIQRLFKEVVLVMDNDEAGRRAVTDLAKLFKGCKVAKLPLKDANDMLKAGREQELFTAVMYEAAEKISDKSLRASEVWHLAEKEPVMGLSWPWPTLTDKTRGRRRGEVYYLGAGVKMGKSVVVDQIAAHCIMTQETPVLTIKPEEHVGGTLKRIAGKIVGRVFHDPKIPFDRDAFNKAKEIIGDKLIVYDGYQGATWSDVKDEIRVCAALGVKDVFVDPLTVFTAGMSLTQQNEQLVAIASELAQMAHELDITAYVFCHLNRPDSGPAHERGGAVQSVQFAGSRAMMRQWRMLNQLNSGKPKRLAA